MKMDKKTITIIVGILIVAALIMNSTKKEGFLGLTLSQAEDRCLVNVGSMWATSSGCSGNCYCVQKTTDRIDYCMDQGPGTDYPVKIKNCVGPFCEYPTNPSCSDCETLINDFYGNNNLNCNAFTIIDCINDLPSDAPCTLCFSDSDCGLNNICEEGSCVSPLPSGVTTTQSSTTTIINNPPGETKEPGLPSYYLWIAGLVLGLLLLKMMGNKK